MEKKPPSDLSHGALKYQNNNYSHSNSLATLSSNYFKYNDHSHSHQQFSKNTSQHVSPVHSPDSAHCTSDKSSVAVITVCSSLSSRLTPKQVSVYSTAQTSQSLNTYSGGNKLPVQNFYDDCASVTPSGRGIVSTHVPCAVLQGNPSSTSRFTGSAYSTSMTNSTIQNSQPPGLSSSPTDLEKRKLIQQQLLLLLHAQGCRQEQTHSTPCATPHCRTMRNVLQHMKNCTDGKNCRKPHCASSRQIISHWKNCSSRECPVCGPLKQGHQQRAIPQRPPSQVLSVASQPFGVNGISPGRSASMLRSPWPQNARRPPPAASVTSTPQSNIGGAYAQSVPNSNVSIPSQSGSDNTGQTDWRSGVNMEHRDHVVRRIVKYILPQPDPAAYSDPRMTNLIEYARKVENAIYTTAKDKTEYFQLLSEKCYKIYKELEEARRRRKSVTSSSENCSASSLPNDSTVGANIASKSSANSAESDMIPSRGLALAEYHQYNSNSNVNIKQESDTKDSGFKKEENVKPFISDSNQLNTSATSIKKIQIKAADSIQPVGSISAVGAFGPPVIADSTKADVSDWKRWSREELLRHFLCLHEGVYADKNAEWFRDPVDPVALGIPDYPDVIKHPMDLTTIRNNLEDGVYTNPWEVLNHFRLMFNNAWLYNKKNSKVYKMCTKLSELFESQVDHVMQAMGYCCGREYSYQQILYCSSANVCTIGKDAPYHMYTNTDKRILICDNYYQCEKCFNEAGSEIMLADEANQAPVPIRKELFERKRNNVTIEEVDVTCKECGRHWHRVCALHLDEIWPAGFVCPGCRQERDLRRKANRFTAKNLPTNKLSNFLERRVNDFLKKKEAGSGEVTIRVLASSDKLVEVKPRMRGRFTESGELSESFPYRLKAIFAFQEIDGQDVCFFGLYIQEYGSESPQPNRRRVYVAYLDSVFYFRPKQYRTDVYHEILVGYLHYAKQLGYTMAHIWACPPAEGDDYIFHMHPPEQRIPKAKRLQDWYKKMLQKAMIEDIVADFKDILKDAIDHHLVSATEIPYFEGDFWPNTLEEILQDLDKEEERRRREEALAETEDDDLDGSRDGDGSHDDLDKRSGKKKVKKRKCSKKSSGSAINKRKKLDGPVDCNTELTRKVYDTMEKLKEIFFVIRLHRHGATASLPPIVDPDALISSELMDSRDSFLQMAREKHLEFSSLRRAKYSTLVMLYELHNEGRQSFLYTCNACKDQIETRWHCNECDEYDLCSSCYKRENHPHAMELCGLGIEEEGSNGIGESSGDRPVGGPDRKPNLASCIAALVHANQCRDANCRMATCIQMKRVLTHLRACPKRSSGTCPLCRQLISMCCLHAKVCTEDPCHVPLCPQLKDRLRQQQIQKRRQQNKSLQRRTNLTRGATVAESCVVPSGQSGPQGNSSVQSSGGDLSSSMADSRQSSHNSSFRVSADRTRVGSLQTLSVNGGAAVSASPRVLPAPSISLQGQQPSRLPDASSQLAWRDGQSTPSQQTEQQPSIQQPSITSTTAFRSSRGGGNGGGFFLTQDANSMAPTQQQIDHVVKVVDLIRRTPVSQEEQNKQFSNWINRHPEYRPAFLALRGRNRQATTKQSQRVAQLSAVSHQAPGVQHQPTVGVASIQPTSSAIALSYNQTAEASPSTPQTRQVAISAAGIDQRQAAQQPAQFASQLVDQQQQQQQYVIAQPIRVRTLPGGPTVIQQQVQSQTQHQADQQWFVTHVCTAPGQQQQLYSHSSPASGQPSTAMYNAIGGGGGTALLTTIGAGNCGPQQAHRNPQQIASQPRLIPSAAASGSQSAEVVRFRLASQQQPQQHQMTQPQQQQHHLLANPATSNPQQQQRQIVALMQQPSPQNPQVLKQQLPSQNPSSSNNPSGS